MSPRQLTVDLDTDQVLLILAGLDTSLRPKELSRLDGGSTEVYRLDLVGGAPPIVLKIYADEPSWTPGKEALVSDWLTAWAELPVPRWLRLDESRQVLPLRYALTTWLPGDNVRALRGSPGITEVYREMGRWLRRLHRLPMQGYGYVSDQGVVRPRSSNLEYMTASFEAVFRQFLEQGGDPAFEKRLERAAQGRLPLAAHSAGAFFAHDDFQPGNLLATREGEALALTGLIDFGNARAADPLFDLAKAVFCCTHEDPLSRQPLLEGYGVIEHPDPEGVLWLYTLYHRLSMWTYLTRLGVNATNGPADLLADLHAMAT
jgi:aminoglycoside phosphotransferase (APT) family kinase protein